MELICILKISTSTMFLAIRGKIFTYQIIWESSFLKTEQHHFNHSIRSILSHCPKYQPLTTDLKILKV